MHWRVERAATAVREAALRTIARRTLSVCSRGGIVSFSFDDIPRSAAAIGSDLLDQYSISGTFYIAGALADGDGQTEPFYSASDIAGLVHRGHEIGCHTFSHTHVSTLDLPTLRDECDRNQQWLATLVPGYTLSSFAYPKGAVSIAAKRYLGRRFDSCRWNRTGINSGSVDGSLLHANKIYSWLKNVDELCSLIENNATCGGWLIFYTHDVSDHPSRYGCTPVDLERVVVRAVQSGSQILNIRDARRILS